MQMQILALDLSLARTGYAAPADSGILVPPKRSDRGTTRLAWFRSAIGELASRTGADLVILEGYSFGQARGSSHHHALGELGGVVRLALHDRGLPYVEIAPATLKKYSTGRGNAPKNEVLAAAIRRLGYAGADDNEADALWLRAMALDHYGLATPTMPQLHRDALAKVGWPDLPGTVLQAVV